jgi:hypothetical protein
MDVSVDWQFKSSEYKKRVRLLISLLTTATQWLPWTKHGIRMTGSCDL